MMDARRRRIILVVSGILSAAAAHPFAPPSAKKIIRITATSCAQQDPSLPYGRGPTYYAAWDQLAAANADIVLLTGDNVYGDCDPQNLDSCPRLEKAYHTLAGIESYSRFNASQFVMATYDDHDFGINNGGKDSPWKYEAQRLFLNFFGVPLDDPRRSRDGIYTSQTFGPPGKRVQIIMLDTRFFLDKLKATVLGEAQWKWLSEQLSKQDVNLRFLVSSFQVLGNRYETWSNIAQVDLGRLWNLLDAKGACNVILVSGDRHIGGFYKLSENSDVKTPPLLEVTSSSLTHTWDTAPPEPGETRIPRNPLVRENHFAQLNIDWEDGEVTVSMIPVGEKDAALVVDSISVTFSHPTKAPTKTPSESPTFMPTTPSLNAASQDQKALVVNYSVASIALSCLFAHLARL